MKCINMMLIEAFKLLQGIHIFICVLKVEFELILFFDSVELITEFVLFNPVLS